MITLLQNLLDRCDVGNIMFFVQQLIEDAGDRGVIYAINNALQYVIPVRILNCYNRINVNFTSH